MSMLAGDIEAAKYINHVFRKPAPAFRLQDCGHAVKSLRNAASNACQRVAVSAEGNRRTDNILEVRSFQKCRDRFRNSFLAALDMIVCRSNLIAAPRQVIAELPDDEVPDFFFAASCPGKEDGTRGCFRSFDSLRMVVRHFRRESGHMPGLLQCVKKPACRGHPHRRAVAVASVGLGIIGLEPVPESAAVSGMRIFPPPFSHGLDQRLPDLPVFPELTVQQRFRHRDRHDRIIGEVGFLAEERKLLCFVPAVKFVGRPNHIAQKCSVHLFCLLHWL